jgi:predicted permease
MVMLNKLGLRLRALFFKSRMENELEEELQFHLEKEIKRNIARGMSPEEARYAALRSFGGIERVKQESRDVRGIRLLEEMWQDLRYSARTLSKQPGFLLVTAVVLALGIGANTAIFSVIDVVMLRSLPVDEPERLALFGHGQELGITDGLSDRNWELFSYPFYRELRNHNQSISDLGFSDVAAVNSIAKDVYGVVNMNGGSNDGEPIDAQLVSGSYFSTLGVKALLGRTLTDADDRIPGGHPVAVASYSWWERKFNGDPAAVGKTITIGSTVYTIIGVTPRGFFGTMIGQSPNIWIPLSMEEKLAPEWKGLNNWSFRSLTLISRLKPGMSLEQASGGVNLVSKQILQEYSGARPLTDRDPEELQEILQANIELTPANRGLPGLRMKFSNQLRALMAMVGIVLLLACANVANLLLARGAARQKELAVRLAVGASRGRLIRQLLTESLLIAGLGGAIGALLAWWGSHALVLMASEGPQKLPVDVAPDLRVFAFTSLASLLSAFAFGTAPAFIATRVNLGISLKEGAGASNVLARSPLGKALVISQIALTLPLLVGAGLFVRSLVNLRSIEAGFNRQNTVIFKMNTSATGFNNDARLANLYREVEGRVGQVPGVRAAAFSMFTFYSGWVSGSAFARGAANPANTDVDVLENYVGPGYFKAMGLPLVLGRAFDLRDTEKAPKVAVINQTMARQLFPNESPIGQRFGEDPEPKNDVEIIGVVKDAKYGSLDEKPQSMAYYPYSQKLFGMWNLVVGFNGDPRLVVSDVHKAIKEVNRNLPVVEVTPLDDQVDRSLVKPKLMARLSTFFGLIALSLACVGLYGVMSYGVSRRTKEIGIRMALGAQTGDILRLILGQGVTLTLIGIGIGVIAAIGLSRLIKHLLFGVGATDPLTFFVIASFLAAVALLACYIPARRAAKVDPLLALRRE